MSHVRLSLESVAAGEADALADLRVLAMRESLERVGRFDPRRARERLLADFRPEETQHVVADGTRVGFVVVHKESDASVAIEHLYIHPGHQGQGIGTEVVRRICAEADAQGCIVRVGALVESDSNRFYQRLGFKESHREGFDVYYVRSAGCKT